MNFRVRTQDGQFLVNATGFRHLIESIVAKINVPESSLIIKRGYPPKQIEVTQGDDDLLSLGFKNNENLIVEIDQTKLPQPSQPSLQPLIQNMQFSGSGIIPSKPTNVSPMIQNPKQPNLKTQQEIDEEINAALIAKMIEEDENEIYAQQLESGTSNQPKYQDPDLRKGDSMKVQTLYDDDSPYHNHESYQEESYQPPVQQPPFVQQPSTNEDDLDKAIKASLEGVNPQWQSMDEDEALARALYESQNMQ